MLNILSIKSKLILALSVIMLVAVTAISVANYKVSRESIRQELLTSGLPLTRDNIYSELHRELMRPIFLSSLMSRDTFLRDWVLNGEKDIDKIQKYLLEINDKYGFITSFFVSDQTRKYYHQSGVLKRISRMNLHDVWYYEFVARGVEYDLDVDTNEGSGGELTLFINYRVEGYDGTLMGVAGVGLKLDWVAGILHSFREKYGRRVYLVDPFGKIQVHSDQSLINRSSIHDMEGIGKIATAILDTRDDPTSFEYDTQGRHLLLSVRYIPEFDWYLLVEQDELDALGAARMNFMRTLIVGCVAWLVIIVTTALAVNHYQNRLERMAVTDPLTGAANRRELETRFERAVSRYQRGGGTFSVVVMDLDGFKNVNDRLGHLMGDKVLAGVTHGVRGMLRPDDLLARWGGDEFVVLARGGLGEVAALAERIRLSVSGLSFGDDDEESGMPVTVSCGVTEYREGDSLDSLTARADAAVYRAKASGRDQVALAQT
ncbi:sensor domain-containing diguanylate cyclase [Desulfovibrio ferrophilus]|uniref:diguanylate cyclase n=1 Tax=Desulfovibrio ferrophilus TaxID=241368 RepID=A0A2Z6AUN8_9BACT|nr:sensor domain-containing diguanylate cyclase [Desulfovibrio ferrophilus]BBD06943.1 diguanylate cyclase [Desulfovibrio ferrophilus]